MYLRNGHSLRRYHSASFVRPILSKSLSPSISAHLAGCYAPHIFSCVCRFSNIVRIEFIVEKHECTSEWDRDNCGPRRWHLQEASDNARCPPLLTIAQFTFTLDWIRRPFGLFFPDPMLMDMPLAGSPLLTLLILVAYFVSVKMVGPAIMEHRRPMNPVRAIRLYNLAQIVFNVVLCSLVSAQPSQISDCPIHLNVWILCRRCTKHFSPPTRWPACDSVAHQLWFRTFSSWTNWRI